MKNITSLWLEVAGCTKVNFFVKFSKKKLVKFTVLRSPFKYKTTRDQFKVEVISGILLVSMVTLDMKFSDIYLINKYLYHFFKKKLKSFNDAYLRVERQVQKI